MKDLAGHNCLQFSYQETGVNEWPVTVKGKPGSIKISGRFQADSLVSLREAAVAGMGIAFMPVYLVREQIQKGQLIPVLRESIYRDVGIYAIYPNIRYVPRKISAFIELLIKHYVKQGCEFH